MDIFHILVLWVKDYIRWNQRKECQKIEYILLSKANDLILNAHWLIFWLYIHIIPISYMSLCILFLFSLSCRVQCHPFSPLYQSGCFYLSSHRKENELTHYSGAAYISLSATDSFNAINPFCHGVPSCVL